MRYAIWNNKGGVGKSFLSFIPGTEIANQNPDSHVILVDMCLKPICPKSSWVEMEVAHKN